MTFTAEVVSRRNMTRRYGHTGAKQSTGAEQSVRHQGFAPAMRRTRGGSSAAMRPDDMDVNAPVCPALKRDAEHDYLYVMTGTIVWTEGI
jgi:hypothetical protein